MKKYNSLFVIILFVVAVFLRVFYESSEKIALLILSVASLCTLAVLSGVNLLKIKNPAPVFVFNNNSCQRITAGALVISMLADFVCCCVNLYRYISIASYNIILGSALISIRGIFALASSVCFVFISLSYSRNTEYDFRKLGVLNLAPLVWSISEGLLLLLGFEQSFDFDSVVFYITVLLSMICLLFFCAEIEKKDGSSVASIVIFRLFGYASVYNFVSAVCSKDIFNERFVFSAILLILGVFMIFLSDDVVRRTQSN